MSELTNNINTYTIFNLKKYSFNVKSVLTFRYLWLIGNFVCLSGKAVDREIFGGPVYRKKSNGKWSTGHKHFSFSKG